MSLYELIAAQPGGPRRLAAARLRYNICAALHRAGLDVRRPGRLRVDRLAEILHDADFELEVRAVPAGEPRRQALEGSARRPTVLEQGVRDG